MVVGGNNTVLGAALWMMSVGEQTMNRVATDVASGRLDDLAQSVVNLNCAKLTYGIGAKLASVANETTGYVLDMLV